MKSSIEIGSILSPLDWTFFVLCLALTFGAVIFGQKKKAKSQTQEDNFLDLVLMGRRLTLPMFVATLVATWYGGIFGVTEIAFNQGIYNFVTQGFFWYLTYIIFALFLVKKVKKFQAMTLPDMVRQMFGKKSGYIAGLFNFFNVVPIAYVISLGLFLQALFGLSMTAGMSLGLFCVLLYSLFGGFRAVVYSDLIQFFIMCLGVFLILVFSITTFGGLSFLQANLPSSHFSPMGTNSLATTLIWGFIALGTLVDPNFYQRCFAAKDYQTARKGILLSTLVWFCFDICTTAGAMYARAVLPEAESGTAYLTYAIQLLPEGLRGLVLAGILATILSTLDSYIFLAGTTLSFDLVPEKWKGKVKVHHLGVLIVGILSFIMAQAFEGNIKAVWKTLGSYSTACLLLPILFGHVFPGKIKDWQFCVTCLTGVIATSYWRNASHTGWLAQIDELYIGILITTLTLLITSLIPSNKIQVKSS